MYYFITKTLLTHTGFPKLVILKAKTGKTLFRPIKSPNPSFQMSCKGWSSFGNPAHTRQTLVNV